MYGFVRPAKSELRLREFARYKSIYCSLCHSLGENYGVLPRFTVNYDLTFLLLLLRAFDRDEPKEEFSRCEGILGKKNLTAIRGEDSKYCAALSIAFACAKFKDNIEDGEHIFLSKLAGGAFLSAYKKVKDDYPGLVEIVESYMEETLLAEKEDAERKINEWKQEIEKVLNEVKSNNLGNEGGERRILQYDKSIYPRAANIFADTLASLFREAAALKGFDESLLQRFSDLARPLAKWIYTIDAFDDYEKDKLEAKHNPFSSFEDREEVAKYAVVLLQLAEAEFDYYLSSLEFWKDAEIFHNIANFGLPLMRYSILHGEKRNKL